MCTNQHTDLFETPELIPENVQSILSHYGLDGDTVLNSHEAIECLTYLHKVGYTFSYGLDGVPYDLRRL